MKRPLPLLAFAALLALPLFSGCIAEIGSRPESQSKPTLGQQLIDLKRAHEAGALSDADYEAQRARFLAQRP